MHSFYHLFFFNKRDIGHLLCILLVFVLSGQQMLLIWAIIDNRIWRQWQYFNALKLVAIVHKVNTVKSHDCDMHITI